MRIAVIDSGVNGIVAGGVSLVGGGLADFIGHGTVVAATIQEKAPDAELYVVKVFDRELRTHVELLAEAIGWCARERMDIANMSLGTANPAHEVMLRDALTEVDGMLVVSAFGYFPGSIPGVVAVIADPECPRAEMRRVKQDGRELFAASPMPKPMPGMPYARGLDGLSFAVANVTGLLASQGSRSRREGGPGC